MKIGDALPGIFKRTYPVLEPSSQMLVVLSLLRFHEIDALPISFEPRQKKRFAVFGYSCLSKLIETEPSDYGKFLQTPCKKSALELSTVDVESELESLLRVFEKTKFGFAWIGSERLGGLANLRDLLSLYGDGVISTKLKVKDVASPIFSSPKDTAIETVLKQMFEHRFRRVFVSGEKKLVTDRRIISHVFSAARLDAATKDPETLLDGKLSDLDLLKPVPTTNDTSLKDAALALKNSADDCLVCKGGVVTPWDLVMKPLVQKKLILKK